MGTATQTGCRRSSAVRGQIAAIRGQVVDAARKQGVSGDKIERVGEAVVQVLSEPADGQDRDSPGSSG